MLEQYFILFGHCQCAQSANKNVIDNTKTGKMPAEDDLMSPVFYFCLNSMGFNFKWINVPVKYHAVSLT